MTSAMNDVQNHLIQNVQETNEQILSSFNEMRFLLDKLQKEIDNADYDVSLSVHAGRITRCAARIDEKLGKNAAYRDTMRKVRVAQAAENDERRT